MYRREYLLTASTAGLIGVGGCLSSTACDETSNHLYVENQLSEPQEIDIQVMRESNGLLSDRKWTEIFRESVKLPEGEYRVIEETYDEHGRYRTQAEWERGHDIIVERELSDVDSCHDRSVTITIAEDRIDILHGIPDHLTSETDSDS